MRTLFPVLNAVRGTLLSGVAAFALTTSALAQSPQANEDLYRHLDTFANVLEMIGRNYYNENIDNEALIQAAIQGMLSSLDPHSAFLPPADFEALGVQTSGSFGGLGIEISIRDDFPFVVSPLDDTPAFQAGLQPDDILLEADGQTLRGLNIQEVVAILRGEVGESIKLLIGREGVDPFEVEIVRDTIAITAARVRLEGDVAVVRISTFNENTVSNIEEGYRRVLTEAAEAGVTLVGVVVDVRNNPGGLLNQSIRVADLFLSEGVITSSRGRSDRPEQVFSARPSVLVDPGLEVVVLINRASASASEIVAAALQENNRALVVGERSFGKGSIQSIIPLPDGSGARLTTGIYLTPSGSRIQAVGVFPDVVIPSGAVTVADSPTRRFSEESLGRRLNPDPVLAERREALERQAQRQNEIRAEDPQLSAALDLLRARALRR